MNPPNINPSLIAPIPKLKRLDDQIKKVLEPGSTAPSTAEAFLRALPKAELHMHSGAANDILTIAPRAWELSQKSDKALQKKYKSLEKMILSYLTVKPGDLDAYLELYDELPRYIIRDLNAIRDMSYQAALTHAKNGVRILEIRKSIKTGVFADARYAEFMRDVKFGPFEELCAHVDGYIAAERDTGFAIKTFMKICFRRSDSPEQAFAALKEVFDLSNRLQEKYGREVIVGVDIMGHEYLNKAKKFREIFRDVISQGKHVTVHAGEGNAPEHDLERTPGEGSIHDALNSGAERIGHGTALFRPTPMLDESHRWTSAEGVRKNAFIASLIFGTTFEMCLTSNLVTGAPITTGYQNIASEKPIAIMRPMQNINEYPFEIIMALGGLNYTDRDSVMCIPATDGCHTLNADIVNQYGLACATFDLDLEVILAISRYSIRRSFAPAEVKAHAMRLWRHFATIYLHDPRFSSPDEQAKSALGKYRKKLQAKLGISQDTIESIIREVHQPEKYLSSYLLERFHTYHKYPE